MPEFLWQMVWEGIKGMREVGMWQWMYFPRLKTTRRLNSVRRPGGCTFMKVIRNALVRGMLASLRSLCRPGLIERLSQNSAHNNHGNESPPLPTKQQMPGDGV